MPHLANHREVRHPFVPSTGSAPVEVPEDIVEDSAGKPVSLLVLRAGPDEREALLSIGHPFFAPRTGRDRIVVVLTDDTA